MAKKKNYTEIEFDDELSFYFFKELDEEGTLIDTYENLNKDKLKEFRESLIAESEGKPKSAKTKRKHKKEEVDSIEEMVDGFIQAFEGGGNSKDAEKGSNDLPERTSNVPVYNFQEKRKQSEVQAKRLLGSLLKFYLTEDYIAENEYIQAKVGLDQLTLSGLINQVKLSESAIEKLMESIDSGEVHPRMFEVLAGMQRVYIDLMKHQSLSIIAAEEHMKKLKDDFDYYQSRPVSESDKKDLSEEGSDENISRGTYGLLKAMEEEDDDLTDDPEDGVDDPDIEFE